MARNMKISNKTFFDNVINSKILEEYFDDIPDCTRYIKTDDSGKHWLKKSTITQSFKFAKNAYAIAILFNDNEYICLINSNVTFTSPIDNFDYVELNSGLFTYLGSEGYLNIKDGMNNSTVLDKVLYDGSLLGSEYNGHDFESIKPCFTDIICFKVDFFALDIYITEQPNMFYWVLCNLLIKLNIFSNNEYNEETLTAWGKIIFEQPLFDKINYKGLLHSYCALTWDITYLYLYQCLEDVFTIKSSTSLYEKLNSTIEMSTFTTLLYEELQWQPRDLDAIESILSNLDDPSIAKQKIESVCNGMDIAKWLYKTRNDIVHETKDTTTLFPDDKNWNKAIAGMICLILES
jgi:hypothetical protein